MVLIIGITLVVCLVFLIGRNRNDVYYDDEIDLYLHELNKKNNRYQ